MKRLGPASAARAAKGGPRRAALQAEELESRQLLSGSPLPALDPIQAKYQSLGGAGGFLGKAVTAELPTTLEPGGRYELFEHGAIYFSAATGAHAIYGAIRAEYLATAAEHDAFGIVVQKILGAPTSDEMNVIGVPGARMNTFQGGTIFWSAATGAHVVYGDILAKYKSLGGAAGFIGLPTSDELAIPGGRISHFQHRSILWTPSGGAVIV